MWLHSSQEGEGPRSGIDKSDPWLYMATGPKNARKPIPILLRVLPRDHINPKIIFAVVGVVFLLVGQKNELTPQPPLISNHLFMGSSSSWTSQIISCNNHTHTSEEPSITWVFGQFLPSHMPTVLTQKKKSTASLISFPLASGSSKQRCMCWVISVKRAKSDTVLMILKSN